MDVGSSVRIVTNYLLVSLGIVFQWEQNLPYPSRQALRPTQPMYNV